MRKTIATVLCIQGLFLLSAQVLDKPVATVKLTQLVSISQREISRKSELLEKQLGRELTKREREELVESEIGSVLLSQAAKRDNIRVSSEELNQYMTAQRQSLGTGVSESQFITLITEQTQLSFEEYEQEVRNRLIQERYIVARKKDLFENIAQPSEAAIRDFFEENATQFTNPVLIRLNQLFFDIRSLNSREIAEVKQQAETLAQDILRGRKTFSQAMEESLDDARFTGGDFGYLARNHQQQVAVFGKPFIDSIFALSKSDISDVLESNVGFHIVQVSDKRAAKLLNLDDPVFPGERVTVRAQIVNYLLNAKQQELFAQAYTEVIAELEDQAEVRRFTQNYDW